VRDLSTVTPGATRLGPALVSAVAASVLAVLSFPPVTGAGIATAILLLGRAAESDQATHRIPNRLLVAAAIALLAAAAASGQAALWTSGAVAGAWLLTLLVLHAADPRLGFGDVKLGGVLGAMIGLACHAIGWDVPHALFTSSAAFVTGAVATLVAATGRGPDRPVPFAPGLVIAVVTITVTAGIAA
jgi:Flp pilus assembly protein protease CpaA